jgi:hypothetical protein
MLRTDGAIGRARVASLRDEAANAREAATALEVLADETETRLVPVQARMGRRVWTGEAAETARAGMSAARQDLLAAASQLREVAHDLRVSAATLDWRAEDLMAGDRLGRVVE